MIPALPDPGETPEAGPDDVVRIKRSHIYIVLIPLAFAAGLGLGFVAWGRAPAATGGVSQAQNPTRLEIEVAGDPSIGPDDAVVTIVEFSDFNCPYCRQWHQQTYAALMSAYRNRVRFVYKDFPILSQESFYAALAAHCAGEQGAYWQFHDALFSGRYPLGRETYRRYSEELGLNDAALTQCVDTGRYADLVESNARYGAGLGVTGTPTFFINGIPLVGAQPLSQFIQLIEGELN